jgi:phosphomevalonate kinase
VVGRISKVEVSAPGKLMVSGEYAVLEGAAAVVAAVDRRAIARVRAQSDSIASAEARAAYRQVEQRLGSLGHEPTVDVSSLRSQGFKLGLGSSAAAAAAAAGLAFAEHGRRDLGSTATRSAIFDAALRGHREISPQGSGADVAAAVFGGFVQVRRDGEQVDVTPIAWPSGLRARVVWTGEEARTSEFLERVHSLALAQPERYRGLMSGLTSEAARFIAAMTTGDVSAVIATTTAYGRGMAALGHAANVPIVTEKLAQIAHLAETAGGAAKPSGAGGGDVALALFPDDKSDQHFDVLCQKCNFTVLLIELGAPGVRMEGALDEIEATA